jgi:hypothetical protein
MSAFFINILSIYSSVFSSSVAVVASSVDSAAGVSSTTSAAGASSTTSATGVSS